MDGSVTTGSPAAETLRTFVNTRNVETQVDTIASASTLVEWLHLAGLLADGRAEATDDDLRLALRLREGLRDAWLAHHEAASSDGPAHPAAARVLDEIAAELPLVLDFTSDPPGFRPLDRGARGGLARLLALIPVTVAEGSWERLKVCPAEDCRWAFFDASRNHSRTWCAMGVCGNRSKTKAYRARRRAG